MGEQHRLGNRERREAAIGIEQTPTAFGQKIPLRRFYLVTLRHNESLSRGLQIVETQPWTSGKYSRPRYARFGRRIVPRGSLGYFGIVSACAENAHVVRGTSIGQRSVAMSSASTSSSAFSTYMRMERTRSRPRFIYMTPPTIECGRGGGIRTRKGLRPPASETGASACSATPRWHQVEESNPNIRF